MTLTEATRQYVRQRAKYLCEYCHSPEEISTSRFTIDHIKPRSLDGTNDVNNLALACSRCNQRRSRFDGTICLITDSPHPPLQTFSPHHPDLLQSVVNWLKRLQSLKETGFLATSTRRSE